MKNYLALLLFAILYNAKLFGQTNLDRFLSPSAVNSSGYSGTGSNYDVKFHKMWLRINPDSALYIAGNVQTDFLTTQNNVASISFDLNSKLKIQTHLIIRHKMP